MTNRINDLRIAGSRIQHYKSIIGFVSIAFVNGFSKSGEVSILIKIIGFSNVNSRIFAVNRTLGDKFHSGKNIFFIQRGDDFRNPFSGKFGIFYNDTINIQNFAIVGRNFTIKVQINCLVQLRDRLHPAGLDQLRHLFVSQRFNIA
ncbi:MAG: hypothetical protein IJW05_11140 [Lentisphaeria bacterium]|nr:hypothetical protein [Lentisphaeria bacterium]